MNSVVLSLHHDGTVGPLFGVLLIVAMFALMTLHSREVLFTIPAASTGLTYIAIESDWDILISLWVIVVALLCFGAATVMWSILGGDDD